jgi:Flp pilus assembly protein TadB
LNIEFLLAVSFGFGIAGVVTRALETSEATLVYRVSAKPSSLRPLKSKNLISLGKALSTKFRTVNSSKFERVLFELPEIIYLLTVSLRAGDGIYRSFATVVPRCDGELARELTKALTAVEFGAAFGAEIKRVSEALPHPQVSEFVSKVSVSLERGRPLARMLGEQGLSVREEIKSRLLRQAGRNETRMLIPLVFLILPVTVLFAVYPSLELLNFGFI